MLVPLYILSPASRSGQNNGLFIYDEAGFFMDTEGNFMKQEGDGIGIATGSLNEGHGIAINNHDVCMSDLNGRLCPLIQGVDYASIPIDSQNPG
jgi:hypothetical protein